MRIGEEAIEQDGGFTPKGSEGGFAASDERVTIITQDAVVLAGADRSHVENAAHCGSRPRPRQRLYHQQ
jgi:hypothetical protein